MKDDGLSGLMSLCQGVWETKVLSVALELEVFTRISGGTDTVDKMSQESGMDVNLLGMLTRACGAMGLLEAGDRDLKNAPRTEKFLVKGSKSYIGDFIILVGGEYYDAWRGLKEVVVTGRPIRDDRMVRMSKPEYAEAYLRAMQGISAGAAEGLAGELGLSGQERLLEVGGGSGTYSIALARKNPGLKAVVFDSPFSCDFANKRIKEMKANNVTSQPGDFVKGALPKGNGIIMLTYVLQGMKPEECEALLKRVYEALPKGGIVVVNEFMLGEEANPAFSSLFALNAFMLSSGGSLHTWDEISGWLRNVGFGEIKPIKASDFIISLTARKV